MTAAVATAAADLGEGRCDIDAKQLHVGIVHVKSQVHLDQVLTLMSRLAVAPESVGACYQDLRDTPQAMHFTKVMLRKQERATVAAFDGSIVATAAVSAPEVTVKSAGAVSADLVICPTRSARFSLTRSGRGRTAKRWKCIAGSYSPDIPHVIVFGSARGLHIEPPVRMCGRSGVSRRRVPIRRALTRILCVRFAERLDSP
jgi:hypothetical protein